MALPIDRRIQELLAESLREISVANGYLTNPDVVEIVDPPAPLYINNHKDKDVLLFIHTARDTLGEKTGGGTDHNWEVFVSAFYRWKDVAVTDPIQRQVQRRLGKDMGQDEPYVLRSSLCHDVQKRMEIEGSTVAGGSMLSGLVDNIRPEYAEAMYLDQYNLPEWKGVEFGYVLEYSTALGDPTLAGN